MGKASQRKTATGSRKSQQARHRPTSDELLGRVLVERGALTREVEQLKVERDEAWRQLRRLRGEFEGTAEELCSMVDDLRRERDEARATIRDHVEAIDVLQSSGTSGELAAVRAQLDAVRAALHLEVGPIEARSLAQLAAQANNPLRVEPGGCHTPGCSSSMCAHRACALQFPGGNGFGCGLLRGHRGPCGAAK